MVLEKNDTAILKLIATNDAQPHNGPMAIMISAEDKNVRPATCALTSASVNNGVPQGFPEFIIPTTAHLWLTVLPPKLVAPKKSESSDPK